MRRPAGARRVVARRLVCELLRRHRVPLHTSEHKRAREHLAADALHDLRIVLDPTEHRVLSEEVEAAHALAERAPGHALCARAVRAVGFADGALARGGQALVVLLGRDRHQVLVDGVDDFAAGDADVWVARVDVDHPGDRGRDEAHRGDARERGGIVAPRGPGDVRGVGRAAAVVRWEEQVPLNVHAVSDGNVVRERGKERVDFGVGPHDFDEERLENGPV